MGQAKSQFIQNFKDTCKQPMSIVHLDACAQEEGESTTHWMRRVKAILHSSDNINVGSAVLMLEKNCHFLPLKQKLGRLKHHCNDIEEGMVALIKYADSDSTKCWKYALEAIIKALLLYFFVHDNCLYSCYNCVVRKS